MYQGHLGKTDKIFVVYPAFAGGNHLINLISLCQQVEPSWLNGEELLRAYKIRLVENNGIDEGGYIAHYNLPNNDNYNSSPGRLIKHHGEFLSQTDAGYINLLAGHHRGYMFLVHQYYLKFMPDFLSNIKNIKWIMITYPTNKNSLCARRIDIEHRSHRTAAFKEEQSIYENFNKSYNWNLFPPPQVNAGDRREKKINEIFTINEQTSISLDSDIYFSDEGSEHVRNLLKLNFDLELPEIADDIHKCWVGMVKKRVKYYDDHGK